MGIPEKSALVVLAVVVTSVVACALFVCREVPDMQESLRDQFADPFRDAVVEPTFDAGPPPAVIEVVEDDWATRAEPAGDVVVPPSQRWYRRKGLAPRWMMRTQGTELDRGSRVKRDQPDLKVDLVRDTLQRPPNDDGSADVE